MQSRPEYSVIMNQTAQLFFVNSSNVSNHSISIARQSSARQCWSAFGVYFVYIEDRRPTTDLAFWKISNGHISATVHPIRFIFGSRVGFSGRRIECLYFRLDQIQGRRRQPSCRILNGIISETVHRSNSCFVLG